MLFVLDETPVNSKWWKDIIWRHQIAIAIWLCSNIVAIVVTNYWTVSSEQCSLNTHCSIQNCCVSSVCCFRPLFKRTKDFLVYFRSLSIGENNLINTLSSKKGLTNKMQKDKVHGYIWRLFYLFDRLFSLLKILFLKMFRWP